MPYFDTHAHLNAEEFDADAAEALVRARDANVADILCVGIDVVSSESAIRLAETYPAVHAAVGIHPNSTADVAADAWQRIEALAKNPRVVALGETGLDRYWDFAPFALQQEYLERHLHLSRDREMPVILHCRDAGDEMLPMLRESAKHGPLRGIMHAFSGDESFAMECLDLGLHVSFAGNVTYSNKKFDLLRLAVKKIPDDRLLIETDSPYLVPQIFRGKQKRNEPANVVHTASFLADLRGVSPEQLAAQTTSNARRLFRLR